MPHDRDAPWWALDGTLMQALTCVILALACSAPLWLRWLPMTGLPQLIAVSRVFVQLNDPQLEFARWYELALTRSPMWLPLLSTGWLAKLTTPAFAARILTFLSVSIYPLGLCALLRALGKPIALALLSVPVLYASPFFQGLVPSSLSAGLALLIIAQLCAAGPRSRVALPVLCCVLALTHPFGLIIVCSFIAAALVSERRSQLQLPWLQLLPLAVGVLLWGACALSGEGVVGFSYPSPMLRILRFSDQLRGGFVARGEGYLLAAMLVLFVLLNRGAKRLPAERALSLVVVVAALGYAVLPASTQSTPAIHNRAGWLALALLPALLPAIDTRGLRERAALLLLALGIASAWFSSAQLRAFDAEASSFAPVLQQVPRGARVIGLTYDNHGQVAAHAAYLYFAAWAQAEYGGFLWLSQLDMDWTIPLRRRANTDAPPPMFSSEWNPTLIQEQPSQFEFYDTALVHGKDPREMTIFMDGRFRLAAQSGKWLLYTRAP